MDLWKQNVKLQTTFFLFDPILMNEHFPTYGAVSAAAYGIIGALIMLIYESHARALKYAQMGHLHSFLKLQ